MTNVTLNESEMWKKLGWHDEVRKVRGTNASIQKFENGEVLYSYGKVVCIYFYGGTQANWYFTPWTEYSKTTQRHVKEFCKMTKDQRIRALESDKAGMINWYC